MKEKKKKKKRYTKHVINTISKPKKDDTCITLI